MKTEIKAQFMAQYYGQEVVKAKDCDVIFTVSQLTFQFIEDVDYLQLRSIDSLTDEEYVQVALIVKPNSETTEKQKIIYGAYTCRNLEHTMQTFPKYSILVAYLRCIGILLPFTYLDNGTPVTLSVDEIVKLGWAKTKKI